MAGQDDAVQDFLGEMDRLSQAEYKEPIQKLIAELDTDDGQLRYGRLLGVMLKEPMARSKDRTEPSETGAWRDWAWVPEKTAAPEVATLWQYQVFSMLRENWNAENAHVPFLDQYATVEEFLIQQGISERRILYHLLKATRKYTCGDAAAKAEIQKAIDSAKQKGFQIENLTSHGAGIIFVSTVSTTLASVIGPMWTLAMGPLITGLAILLLVIGTEAFCTWSEEVLERFAKTESLEQYHATKN
jgi:hypothetical protein